MDLKQCKVLVTTTSFGINDPEMKSYLEQEVGEVIYNPTGKPLKADALGQLLVGIDGLIAGLDEINRTALEKADRLKVISRYGVGIENVDLEFAASKGIVVTNTPGANSSSVAEMAIALILLLCRPICMAAGKAKQGEWPRTSGLGLVGKIVGIYGFGAIGKEVAKRLAGFGCRLLTTDIKPDRDFAEKTGVEIVDLDQLLKESDFLSLHIPSTKENHNLVSDQFLMKMKTGSYLINTARGALVDDDALARAIQNGHLAGAALDTFKQEPVNLDNPLLKCPQVIITPHMAAHTDSAMNAMGWTALKDCLAVLRGETPKFTVTK